MRLDHELLRNLILSVRGSIAKLDYKSIGAANLYDDYYGTELGINYLINRYANFNAGYEYTRREGQSNIAAPAGQVRDFEVNQVFIRLECQL